MQRAPALSTTLLLLLASACGDDAGGGDAATSGDSTTTAAASDPSTTTGAGASTGDGGATGHGGSGGGGQGPAGGSTGSGGGGASDRVPVLIAQGHLGRTTISCDDGRTWIRDRSVDDTLRCYDEATGNLDCDHHPFAARGIAFGDDTFVLTWGWGPPGEVQRSTDLDAWETVVTGTTFADVAHAGGRFVANGGTTLVSDDAGLTWAPGGDLGLSINTRSIDVDATTGTFVVTGESGDQRAIVRSADGVTWTAATTRPDACVTGYRGGASSGGTLVIGTSSGAACVSRDAGDTWEVVQLGERFTSGVLHDGAAFVVYEGGTRHRSVDGTTWESAPIAPAGIAIGTAAVSAQGTFVAVNEGWNRWYEQQRFYRSEDGLTWEELPEGAHARSHPVYFMAAGTAAPSPGCGAP